MAGDDQLITQIKQYRLVRELGRGGMGTVYEAIDTRDGGRVALKVLHPWLDAEDRSFRDRFEREAHIAALLRSPYSVRLLDFGATNGRCFLVMEYVQGSTLADLIATGPLDPLRALRIAIDVARALEEAAARGIVHRDIKPSNILLTDDGRVKVTDFGIARHEGSAGITASGTFVGTAEFAAPEQVTGEADHRTDIYALGAVLYTMLTGHPPFSAPSPWEVLRLHQTARLPVAPLSHLPDAVANPVRRCLEKDPRDRYQEPAELAAALERAYASYAQLQAAPTVIQPPAEQPPVTAPPATFEAGGTPTLAAPTAAMPTEASTPTIRATPTPAAPPSPAIPVPPGPGPARRRGGVPTAWVAAGLALTGVAAIGVFLLFRGGGGEQGQVQPGVTPTAEATTAVPTNIPTTIPATIPTTEPTPPPATAVPATAVPTTGPEIPERSFATGEWTFLFKVVSNGCGGDPVVGTNFNFAYYFDETREPRRGYISDGDPVRITHLGGTYTGNVVFFWPNLFFDYPIEGGHAYVAATFLTAHHGMGSLTETYELDGGDTCSIFLRDDG